SAADPVQWMALKRARKRGASIVVIDPARIPAVDIADLWLAPRPGTDAALILGMVNLMINENGHYDESFLRKFTNAPYLVGGNELYVRDPESDKPLVWDAAAQAAKPFDADVGEFALEGSHEVKGKPAPTPDLL
ncbi:MAG: molybdopterin-dependent oxidoreductase, partial [Nitrospinota bacterium]|nr:molybdopterin-dependent oxidoreductase [Nitrospinota bacterium]